MIEFAIVFAAAVFVAFAELIHWLGSPLRPGGNFGLLRIIFLRSSWSGAAARNRLATVVGLTLVVRKHA
jgi:hypothetical protein